MTNKLAASGAASFTDKQTIFQQCVDPQGVLGVDTDLIIYPYCPKPEEIADPVGDGSSCSVP